MGLFEKKYCSVCGEKIGLFGNRKLEDGNLCKDCASKLSPWFSDRRQSTVEEIKEQLRYREANKEEVASFNPTRTVGLNGKIYIDEDQKKFILTHVDNWRDSNPDVLSFSQITGCRKEIQETKTEEKTKDREGHFVSYDPPRYNYSYDFRLIVYVNHPYFDDMTLRYNSSSVKDERPDTSEINARKGLAQGAVVHGPEYRKYEKELDELYDIVESLRLDKDQAPEPVEPARTPVKCIHCGAITTPDDRGCCEYCGLPVDK
jgi:hypothetical protein